MMLSPSPTSERGQPADPPLGVHVDQVLQRHGPHLLGHRAQIGAAMLAGDLAFALQPLQVLADGGFRHREGVGEVAHPGAALFLQPFQDLHPARLGQQAGAAGDGALAGGSFGNHRGTRSWF
jgi:hypothetical protein